MKKAGGLALILLAALLPLFSVQAQAAVCANTSSFGAVSLQVPELSKLEGQTLWLRVQTTEPSSRLLVEINETECLNFDLSGVPGQWTWQMHQSGGTMLPLTFPQASGNIIKLIGVDAGVKVDRVLLAEPDCLPQDFGDNCQNSVELSSGVQAEALPPPSAKPVNGKVVLSPTPEAHRSDLKEVKYRVDNRLLQTANTPQPFDTTLVANGKYTVAIETILQDGTSINETTVIEVRNPENFLTPAVRFIRLNGQLLLRIAGAAGLLAVLYLLAWVIRRRRRAKREREFRGL